MGDHNPAQSISWPITHLPICNRCAVEHVEGYEGECAEGCGGIVSLRATVDALLAANRGVGSALRSVQRHLDSLDDAAEADDAFLDRLEQMVRDALGAI